jgi:serine/threonine protein phosphatase PrpC
MAADYSSRQWIGRRTHQEDACAVLPLGDGRIVAVVADGLGGHAAGEVASRIVVEAMVAAFAEDARGSSDEGAGALLLRRGLDEAVRRLADAEAADPRVRGLASTLVAAVAGNGVVEWLSVGDSVLWMWRGGRLVRLNADHSGRARFDALVSAGQLDRRDADVDPRRHLLASAVSSSGPELIDEAALPLAEGDALLLATDGILALGQADIEDVLATRTEPGAWCAALVDRVMALGLEAQDNVTVVALRTPSSRSTS